MAKLMKKSPSLKLLPILVLLVITPLLSASLRFKYLYFVVNILIIALGAEAGLFSFPLQSATEDIKQTPGTQHEQPPPPTVSEVPETKSAESDNGIEEEDDDVEKSIEDAEKSSSNEILVQVKVSEAPATPASIFFIEGVEDEEEEEGDLVKEDGNEGDQDLFHKAESFIGNFYKQLKMQRELSSNRLSKKAF